MQVKIFESTDMASGLRKVRQELGPDALILSTRTVKSGKFGIIGKQILEITAAIDTPYPDEYWPLKEKKTLYTQGHSVYRKKVGERENSGLQSKKNGESHTTPATNISDTQRWGLQHNPPGQKEDYELQQEFIDLKNTVTRLASEISRLHSFSTSSPSNLPHVAQGKLTNKLYPTEKQEYIENLLISRGISPESAKSISSFALERLGQWEIHDAAKLHILLHEILADIIAVQPPDYASNNVQKKMALVGPTGVGKTTTLAKLAAGYIRNHSDSIALITIDTYRIAAVEQLKVYAEIMNLPVDVVITPLQLEKSLEKYKDKDLILIDTAGRSPRDVLCLEELKTFLSPRLEIENHLVLSATTRDHELLQTVHQFHDFDIKSTIFTKLDECYNLGVLLNVQIQNSSPISYITNGQRVPEDIREADSASISQLILPFPGGIVHD